MPDQEGVEFTIDPRSVSAALGQMNNAITAYEKGAVGANDRLNNSFQRVSDMLLKMNDRSYNSQERLVKSIERQAAAYGRTGVEKLISQRDAHIKRLGDEENQIKRVTAAYEKMIKAEEAGGEGHGMAAQKGFLAAKDLFEGRNAYATVEAGKTLLALQGAPAIMGAAAAGAAIVGTAVYEMTKHFAESSETIVNMSAATGIGINDLDRLKAMAALTATDLGTLARAGTEMAQTLDQGGEKSIKLTEALARIGVSTRSFNGAQKDEGALLVETLGHLASVTDKTERLALAAETLGPRTSRTLQPLLSDYSALREEVEKLGYGTQEGLIKQGSEAAKTLHTLGLEVEQVERFIVAGALEFVAYGQRAVEALAPIRPYVADILAALIPLADVMKTLVEYRDLKAKQFQETPEYQQTKRLMDLYHQYAETLENVSKAKAAVSAKNFVASIGGGEDSIKEDIKDQEKKRGDALAIVSAAKAGAGVGFESERTAELQVRAADNALASDRKRLEVIGQQKEIVKEILKLTEEQSIKAKYPNGLLPSEQKVLEFTGRPSVSQDQVKEYSDLLLPNRTKEAQDALAKGLARGREEARKASGLIDQTPQTAEDQTRQLRERSAAADRDFLAGLARENKQLESEFRASTAVIVDNRATQLKQAEAGIKIGGILNDRNPQDQLRTSAQLLGAQAAEIEDRFRQEQGVLTAMIVAAHGTDASLEDRQQALRIKHASDIHDLQIEFATQVAQEQRHQFETIQKDAEGLFNTLFTKPAEFGKQLAAELKAAFLKPVTEGLSNTVASGLQPLIYGKDGNGGIAASMKGLFSSKPLDPAVASSNLLKGATDINTGATDRNTDALLRVAESWERGSGGSGAAKALASSTETHLRRIADSTERVEASGAPSVFGGGFSGLRAFAGRAALGVAGFAGVGGLALPAYAGTPQFTPQVTSTLGGSDMEGLSGRGGFEGIAGGVPYEPSPVSSSLFGDNPAAMLGPGATAPFAAAGGWGGFSSSGSTSAGGGGFLSAIPKLFGGSTSANANGSQQAGGQGGLIKSLSGIATNFKGTNWGSFTRQGQGIPGPGDGTPGTDTGGSGKITGVGGLAGAGLQAGGMYLAQRGLLGQDRGTGKGILEGAGGGAAIGFQMGGPIGAAVGAAIGAGIGLGEMIAGVESDENKAKRLVKELYHVDISIQMARQIVQIANSKYGHNVNYAIRSPEVRQMLELYSAGTGQAGKMPLSSTTPTGASLSETGGRLYQDQTYKFGNAYIQQSSLPVAGGGNPSVYPSSQQVVLNVNGQSAADLLEGRIASTVNPSFVQSQFAQAQASSNGRLQNSAMVQAPGLVFG